MSQINQAMETLTAQWYNAVVTGLGLSNQQFQLYQGSNSVVKTSIDLWNMFNAVPPDAVNANYLDPSQANNFSSDYNLILSALVATSDSNFQNCMGDYYTDWFTYIKDNPPSPVNATTVTDAFNNWAVLNAPGKAGCKVALNQIYIDPINEAILMFDSANGTYAWNKTIDALNSALAGSTGQKSFEMNSATQSHDVSQTWAAGVGSVFFDLFSFGGNASYNDLSIAALSSGIDVTATYKKVTTFTAGPLSTPNPNDLILAKYSPWYLSAVLAKAYTVKNNTVWNNQANVNWDTAFGTGGFLQRMTTSLIVADGITIKITSTASFDSSEQTQIKGSASTGIWPFFKASGSGGSKTTVTFNDYGQFSIETTIEEGNPQCLGILQTPISTLFS